EALSRARAERGPVRALDGPADSPGSPRGPGPTQQHGAGSCELPERRRMPHLEVQLQPSRRRYRPRIDSTSWLVVVPRRCDSLDQARPIEHRPATLSIPMWRLLTVGQPHPKGGTPMSAINKFMTRG